MRNNFLSFLMLLSFCAHAQTYSFTHNSIVRSYIVHLPTGYTTSTQYPLVINMHGYTSTASQQQTYSQMDAVADTGKFIVVYPDGVNNAWNAGFGTNPTIDDVGFLSALIDTLKVKFSINALKVYACGLSNGGFMSYRLACELQDKIAAIAPVAGLMSDSTRLFCQNTCPVPVMHFHGTSDAVVNYNGSLGYVSADSVVKIWRIKDGCPQTPVTTSVADINPLDGCTVTKYVYGPGQNSSEVVFFKITSGGHTWPGGFPIPSFGNTNQDIKASGEIWKFFKKHSLQCGANEVSEPAVKGGQLSVFPNPSEGKFSFLFPFSTGSEISIAIYNVLGEKVPQSFFYSSFLEGSVVLHPELQPGVYFLQVETLSGKFTQKLIKQ